MGARLPAPLRRRQLLDVAITVFARRGYANASMNDVADAAGVTKPVLYQHFRSKHDLYLAALDDVGDRLRRHVEQSTGKLDSPREQVIAGLSAYFRFVADHGDAFGLLFGDGSRRDPDLNRAARAAEDAVGRSVGELIAVSDLAARDRELLGHAIVGMAEGACRYWLAEEPRRDPAQLATRIAQLAWAGLRGVGAEA